MSAQRVGDFLPQRVRGGRLLLLVDLRLSLPRCIACNRVAANNSFFVGTATASCSSAFFQNAFTLALAASASCFFAFWKNASTLFLPCCSVILRDRAVDTPKGAPARLTFLDALRLTLFLDLRRILFLAIIYTRKIISKIC